MAWAVCRPKIRSAAFSAMAMTVALVLAPDNARHDGGIRPRAIPRRRAPLRRGSTTAPMLAGASWGDRGCPHIAVACDADVGFTVRVRRLMYRPRHGSKGWAVALYQALSERLRSSRSYLERGQEIVRNILVLRVGPGDRTKTDPPAAGRLQDAEPSPKA